MPRRQIATGPSCLECRRRKIKCDRRVPCGYCVRCEISCSYPETYHQLNEKATPNRTGHVTAPTPGNTAESGIAARLQAIEGSVKNVEQQILEVKELLAAPGVSDRQGPQQVVWCFHELGLPPRPWPANPRIIEILTATLGSPSGPESTFSITPR